MSGSISFTPMATTNAAGSFQVQSAGYIQGFALDDPAMRNQLASASLASAETLPMWGGVAMFVDLAPASNAGSPGSTCGRALTNSAINAFSVYNQGQNAINTPQSTCPLWSVGMTVPLMRLGSLNRIVVAADPALVSLAGGAITQAVSWDFVNQRLVAAEPVYPSVGISGVTYSTGTGLATYTTSSAHGLTNPSTAEVTITGVLPAGYNGTFDATVTGTSTFTVPFATSPGSYVSGGTLAAGGGTLACKVLAIHPTGNMTVAYNATTNQASWNRNAAVAIILI